MLILQCQKGEKSKHSKIQTFKQSKERPAKQTSNQVQADSHICRKYYKCKGQIAKHEVLYSERVATYHDEENGIFLSSYC